MLLSSFFYPMSRYLCSVFSPATLIAWHVLRSAAIEDACLASMFVCCRGSRRRGAGAFPHIAIEKCRFFRNGTLKRAPYTVTHDSSRLIGSGMDQPLAVPHGRTTAARPDRSNALAASGYTSWDAISESLLRARADARAPSARSVRSQRTQDSRHGLQNAHHRGPASESGTSLASSGTVSSRYSSSLVSSRHAHGRAEDRDGWRKSERSRTSDSAFRRGARFLQKSETLRAYALVLTLLGIVLVKWCVGLGGYSGKLCRALFPSRKERQSADQLSRNRQAVSPRHCEGISKRSATGSPLRHRG